MKLTKSDLKAVVKECLVEILAEGLGGSLQTAPKNTLPMQQPILSNRSRVIQPEAKSQKRFAPTPQLREAVYREAGGDKVMESILADTARTTLAAQIAHGDSRAVPGSTKQGLVQQEQVNGTPEQLFGEDVTSKWANLAFMDSPLKK